MSPLGAAIVALILTVVIGYVAGQVIAFIGSIIAAASESFVAFAITWVTVVLIWGATIVLGALRVIDLVRVATSA